MQVVIVLWLIARVFPPPSQSYYCLLKVNSEDADKEDKQYLVCFLSIGKEGLDLYPHDQIVARTLDGPPPMLF